MIPRRMWATCPASLRGRTRKFAGRVRGFAGALWKFLGLGDSHDHSCGYRFRLDIAVLPQPLHPALERSRIESGLFLDLAITDGRAAQHPADIAVLMRLPENQPSVEPNRRTHSCVVPQFEEHASQPRVEILASHRWSHRRAAAFSGARIGNIRRQNFPERIFSTPRSTERALPHSRAASDRESPASTPA
jgi:hypothetical protein